MGDPLWMKLKAARRGASLTQMQLAKILGITRPGYAFHETAHDDSRTTPNVEQIKLIASAVGVPYGTLMDSATTVEDVIRAQLGGVQPAAPAAAAAASADLFVSAVQFAMQDRGGFRPELSVGPVHLDIDYMRGKTVAVLLTDPSSQEVRDGMGRLLLAETVIGRRMDKRMVLFSRQPGDVQALSDAAMAVVGITVRIVSSAEQVAHLLAQ